MEEKMDQLDELYNLGQELFNEIKRSIASEKQEIQQQKENEIEKIKEEHEKNVSDMKIEYVENIDALKGTINNLSQTITSYMKNEKNQISILTSEINEKDSTIAELESKLNSIKNILAGDMK